MQIVLSGDAILFINTLKLVDKAIFSLPYISIFWLLWYDGRGDSMRFKKIYIEITNTCNLSCDFCIKNVRPVKRMSLTEFSYILQEIKPYTSFVYLHVLGEPLSHPDLEEMLALCASSGIKVNITTNGTLLHKQQAVLMRSAIRQVNISLHSFPEHLQERYLEDAIAAGKALAAKGCFISYRLWSLQDQRLPAESMAIMDALSKAYEVSIDHVQTGTVRLADYTFLHFDEVFGWPSMQAELQSTIGTCLGMKQMCAILSDGSLVPCCLDSRGDITLGNIFETPFQTLIEGERAKNMCLGFQQHQIKEELCRRCQYRLRFDKGGKD